MTTWILVRECTEFARSEIISRLVVAVLIPMQHLVQAKHQYLLLLDSMVLRLISKLQRWQLRAPLQRFIRLLFLSE